MSDAGKLAKDLLSEVPNGSWTIERHGGGEALYIGRTHGPRIYDSTHGLNIVYLTEPAHQWPGVRALIVQAPQLLKDLIGENENLQIENERLRKELKEATLHAIQGYVPAQRVSEVKAKLTEAMNENDRWHGLVSRLRTYLNIPFDATHADAPELAQKALSDAAAQAASNTQSRLDRVLVEIDETLDGMISRPSMYGAPQTLESSFLTILDLKITCLGLVAEERTQTRWVKFINEVHPGPGPIPLSGRRESWDPKEFVSFMQQFRERVGL